MMKKLSQELKSFNRLNESVIDSRESFALFARNALRLKLGTDYSEDHASVIIDDIFNAEYPNYTAMLERLTVAVMTDSQKDREAFKLVREIFYEIVDNPNQSIYYSKLSKALHLDNEATVSAYMHNLSSVANLVNIDRVDLFVYMNTETDEYTDYVKHVSTPEYALQVIESGLMLYNYILANNPDRDSDQNNTLKQFYLDILKVYNSYKDTYTVYAFDLTTASNFFQSSLSAKNPGIEFTAGRITQIVTQSVMPVFAGSYMRILMDAYRMFDMQVARRVPKDKINKFTSSYERFLDVTNTFESSLFALKNVDYTSVRLKQLYQLGLSLREAIEDPAASAAFRTFMFNSKYIIDDLEIIQTRTFRQGL